MPTKKGLNPSSDAIKAFRVQALAAMEKQHVRWLIRHHTLFVDFWKDWCKAYLFKYEDFLADEKLRKKAAQCLRAIKCRWSGKRTKTIRAENFVIFHEEHIDKNKLENKEIKKLSLDKPYKRKNKGFVTTEEDLKAANESQNGAELITRDDSSEVIRHTHKIQKKKISEISFSSPVTIATVERITQASQFTQYFAADYLYFLSGGKDEEEKLEDGRIRKRFNQQLSHLEVAQRLRLTLQTTIDNMIEAMETNSLGKKQEAKIKRNIAMIESAMKAARELDLQPVHFLNSIEEGAFSAQKALQGAVSNDRMMVDNGNVIFEQQEAKVFQKENIEDDLKRIGDALLDSHIETLSEKELTNEES